MSGKQYLNAFMNNSATIRDVLAEDVENAPHKVVAFSDDGKLALPAADGAPVIGILLSDTPADNKDITTAGCEVDVLIKNIGLAEAGDEVAKGDFLTATTDGTVRKAEAGEYIFGIAMTAATAAGELAQVYITHGGYAKAASGGGGTPPTGN